MLETAAILAGGLATRMHPETETIAKAMLDVCGEPFIAHQLRLLRHHQITKAVLCIGHLGEQIKNFVGNGEQFDMEVHYSFDGSILLGTGGSIRKALPILGQHFFVIYGDSYLECDYQAVAKMYFESGKLGLMTVYRNSNKWDRNNVEFDGESIVTYDKENITPKMEYIDYGLSIFNQKAFENMPSEPFDLSYTFQSMLRDKQLAAYEVEQRFFEIGSHKGLRELEQYLEQGLEKD